MTNEKPYSKILTIAVSLGAILITAIALGIVTLYEILKYLLQIEHLK